MFVWAVALAAAARGVRAGHESQQGFSRAVRARRQLMEHRLVGDDSAWVTDRVLQDKPDADAPERHRENAEASQKDWLTLTQCSLLGFIVGALIAAVSITLPHFKGGPVWGPYDLRTWWTGSLVGLGFLVVVGIVVFGVVRLSRRRSSRNTTVSPSANDPDT